MTDGTSAADKQPPVPSEAMVRIRKMLRSGVVSAGDRVRYTIKTTLGDFQYAGELTNDGRIINPKEVHAPVAAPKGNGLKKMDFESPTLFADAMYKYALPRLPRGMRRPCINGWNDCYACGKCLNELFNQHLRKERSAPVGSKLKEPEDMSASLMTSATEIKKELFGTKDDGKETSEQVGEGKDEAEKKESSEEEGEVAESMDDKLEAAKKQKKEGKDGGGSAERLEKIPNGDVSKKKESPFRGPNGKTDGQEWKRTEKGTKRGEKGGKSGKGPAGLTSSAEVEKGEKGASGNVERAKKLETDPPPKPANHAISQHPTDTLTTAVAAGAASASHSRGAASGQVQTKSTGSPSPEKGTSSSSEEVASRTATNKRKTVGAKTHKRKRSITPLSDVERATRAKSRRRILDPAAAEAAAVAAAAEKQEAASLRPTTRLTSGKIPKVVYNSTPTKPMAADHDLAEGAHQVQLRSSRRRDGAKRTPRRTRAGSSSATNPVAPNGKAAADEDDASDRTDNNDAAAAEEKSDALYMLDLLGCAVRRSGSTTPSHIVSELRGKSVNVDDAKALLSAMLDDIREVNALAGYKAEGSDLVDQMLAYLAMEIARWNADVRRPISELTRSKATLDKKRTAAEKHKRRMKREHDETMAKLENDMEERRKAETEAAKAGAALSARKLMLQLEKDMMAEINEELAKVRAKDAENRREVEYAKKLWAQLNAKAKDKQKKMKEAAAAAAAAAAQSDGDNDVVMQNAEDTLDDEKAEIERLRKLVRAREAEAEECQRQCEVASFRLRALLDKKHALDNQLYKRSKRSIARTESAAAAAAAAAAGGGSAPGPSKKEKKSGKANGDKSNGPSKTIKKSKHERAKRKTSKPTS